MAIIDREILAEEFAGVAREMGARLAGASLRPAMIEMKQIAEEGIAINFLDGTRADGTAWAPRKRDYPWPILIHTGTLMRSAATENAAGHIETIGDRDLMTGTNVYYAAFHQYGTKKMPARPFQEVSEATVDLMEEALVDFIQSTIFSG